VKKESLAGFHTWLLLLILILMACSLAFQVFVYKTDPTRQFIADLLTPLAEDYEQSAP